MQGETLKRRRFRCLLSLKLMNNGYSSSLAVFMADDEEVCDVKASLKL